VYGTLLQCQEHSRLDQASREKENCRIVPSGCGKQGNWPYRGKWRVVLYNLSLFRVRNNDGVWCLERGLESVIFYIQVCSEFKKAYYHNYLRALDSDTVEVEVEVEKRKSH
jgi:hypothetical protein